MIETPPKGRFNQCLTSLHLDPATLDTILHDTEETIKKKTNSQMSQNLL